MQRGVDEVAPFGVTSVRKRTRTTGLDNRLLIADDDYETPRAAYKVVLDFLPTTLRLWDPFHCTGNSRIVMEELGFNCYHEDRDFYTYVPENVDVIATNPPFSDKRRILKRLIEIGKPFAILLPVTVIGTRYYADMFEMDTEVRLLIPISRIQFLKNQKATSACTFSTLFLTRGLNQYIKADRQLIYVDNRISTPRKATERKNTSKRLEKKSKKTDEKQAGGQEGLEQT